MKLLVINDFGISGGGAENRARLLLKKFVEKNRFSEIHLLEHKSSGSKMDGIKVHKCEGGFFGSFLAAKKIIEREEIDAIQCHNLTVLNPSCILAAKLARKPVFWFVHDFWAVCGKRSFIDPEKAEKEKLCEKKSVFSCAKCVGVPGATRLFLQRIFLNLADAAFAPTGFSKKALESRGIMKGKWHVVAPWINTGLLETKKEKRKLQVFFAGSLADYKGAFILAKAFKIIAEKDNDAKLAFVGSEQEKESQHRKKIEEILGNGLLKKTIFLGRLEQGELFREYKKSIVFVLPSICMELTGTTWMEAFSCGTPCVVSRLESLRDFAEGNALLFEPKNEKDLAEKILLLLRDKRLWNRLSEKGLNEGKIVFSPETAESRVFAVYKKILGIYKQ